MSFVLSDNHVENENAPISTDLRRGSSIGLFVSTSKMKPSSSSSWSLSKCSFWKIFTGIMKTTSFANATQFSKSQWRHSLIILLRVAFLFKIFFISILHVWMFFCALSRSGVTPGRSFVQLPTGGNEIALELILRSNVHGMQMTKQYHGTFGRFAFEVKCQKANK